MNKNNAKDFLPFVQALAEGKTIQIKDSFDGSWKDIEDGVNFGFDPEHYRIKPETTKWWVMPNFDWDEQYNPSIGLNYFVEEQKDSYSKNRPPLKSDFNSKEAAERWLNNYLLEQEYFQSAAKRFEVFSAIMSGYADRFKHHKPLERHYLEFKVHEFLEDVDKMDESIWSAGEGE